MEVDTVVEFEQIHKLLSDLANKDTIMIQNEPYRLQNVVTAYDGDVLKTRVVLVNNTTVEDFELMVDIGLSAKIYKKKRKKEG